MAMVNFATLEGQFFRTLNAFVEPAVSAGWGSPWIVPVGLITLETTGRLSGDLHRTPVVAVEIEGHLLVSTVRGNRSEWIKNMRKAPEVRYWLRGQAYEAKAVVFASSEGPPEGLPSGVRCAASLSAAAVGLDMIFAVLAPHS